MNFVPVERSRAFESVVSQIEDAIYSGSFKIGESLPSERALVDMFQVSRSSVREALRILESMGLIITKAGSRSGPVVSLQTTEGITRLLSGTLRTKSISLSDLVQYRMVSGEMANRLACAYRTDADLDDLQANIDDMAATRDESDFARFDAQFHDRIREIAGNRLMAVQNAAIEPVIVDQVESALKDSEHKISTRESFVASHREILTAIRDRDAEEAGRLAKQSLYDNYVDLLEEEDRVALAMLL